MKNVGVSISKVTGPISTKLRQNEMLFSRSFMQILVGIGPVTFEIETQTFCWLLLCIFYSNPSVKIFTKSSKIRILGLNTSRGRKNQKNCKSYFFTLNRSGNSYEVIWSPKSVQTWFWSSLYSLFKKVSHTVWCPILDENPSYIYIRLRILVTFFWQKKTSVCPSVCPPSVRPGFQKMSMAISRAVEKKF